MNDIELLDLWCAGDASAGDQLMRRYFEILRRFFINKVHGDSDDLVQQTMAALVKNRVNFERRSTFQAYLLSIARYQLYEFVRRRRRTRSVLDYDTVTAFDLSPSPSSVAASQRERGLLLEALRRIPINFQVALELHYWEDLSGPELAEVLGVPLDTAYSRVRKGRALLKRQLHLLAPSRAGTSKKAV